MLTTFMNTLMSAEADAVCGAPYGESSPERTNVRNGYRHREFDTRAGTWTWRSRSCARAATSRTGCSSAADALVLKVREGGWVVNVHALVATGVNAEGHQGHPGLQRLRRQLYNGRVHRRLRRYDPHTDRQRHLHDHERRPGRILLAEPLARPFSGGRYWD
jgi:mutator family transposase